MIDYSIMQLTIISLLKEGHKFCESTGTWVAVLGAASISLWRTKMHMYISVLMYSYLLQDTMLRVYDILYRVLVNCSCLHTFCWGPISSPDSLDGPSGTSPQEELSVKFLYNPKNASCENYLLAMGYFVSLRMEFGLFLLMNFSLLQVEN